jgi:hypothetical protein
MNAEQTFEAVTKAIGEVSSAQEQATLNADAFGAKNVQMLNVIREGPEAFNAARQAAQQYGAVLSDDLIKSAGNTIDKFEAMRLALGNNLSTVFVTMFKPAIDMATQAMADLNYQMAAWLRAHTDLTNASSSTVGQALFDDKHKLGNIEQEIKTRVARGDNERQLRDYYKAQIAEIQGRIDINEKLFNQAQTQEMRLNNSRKRQADALSDDVVKDTSTKKTTAAKKTTEFTLSDLDAQTRKQMDEFNVKLANDYTPTMAAFTEEGRKAAEALKAQGQAVVDSLNPWADYEKTVAELNRLYEEGAISVDVWAAAQLKAQKDAVEQNTVITEQEQQLQDLAQQLGTTFESAFLDAVGGGKSFSDIMTGLIGDIEKMIVKVLILQPLMDALFGKQGTSGGGLLGAGISALGTYLGGLGGTATGASGGAVEGISLSGGAGSGVLAGHAGGGRVNGPTWVGERGPELLIPSGPATVMNNHAATQMAGATPNFKVEVTNKGSTPTKATQSNAKFDGKQWVVGIILEDMAKGGPISNGLGNTYGMRRKA